MKNSSNLSFFVKKFEESDERNLINNAKELLQILNGKEVNKILMFNQNLIIKSKINLETSICDRIFNACITRSSLLNNEEAKKIIIYLLILLASSDFNYFVKNYVPVMIKSDEIILYILSQVSSIIINPLSGFLYNLLSQSNNINNKYNLFDSNSPDLDTPIGQTLTNFRKILTSQIKHFVNTKENTVTFNLSKSICSFSILYPYRHSEMPTCRNLDEVSLGFSDQNEILYILSFFLNQQIFTKEKNYCTNNTDTLVLWEDYYKEISGFDKYCKFEPIPLFHMKMSEKVPVSFHFLKLIPFLNLPSLEVIFDDEMYLLAQILGNDPISASFYVCLCQIFLLIDEKFATRLFDGILKIGENLESISNYQYHTLIYSTSRFIDVLCVHKNCRIAKKHITQLNSLALLGFCSTKIEIRKASYKLIKSLGRLDPISSPIFDFIEQNEKLFENFIFDFFENYQKISSIIIPKKKSPKTPLTLEVAINARLPEIWQIYLLSFGSIASSNLSKDVITKFKELATTIFSLFDAELELNIDLSSFSNSSQNMSTFISSHFSLNSIFASNSKSNMMQKASKETISSSSSGSNVDTSTNSNQRESTSVIESKSVNDGLNIKLNENENSNANSDSDLLMSNSKPKLNLSLSMKKNPNPRNILNPTYPIHIMTLLVAMTKVDDNYNSKIIKSLFFFLKSFHSTNLNCLLVMVNGLPSNLYEKVLSIPFIDHDSQDSFYPHLLLLWSIAWSSNFENFMKKFDSKFIDVFINVTIGLANNNLLFFTLTKIQSHNEEKVLSNSSEILTIYVTVCYRIFSHFSEKFKSVPDECFPCRPFADTSKHQELLKFSLLFQPIFNMSLFEPKSNLNIGKRLKLFSIQTLNLFFACCKFENTNFLFNEIPSKFDHLITYCPSILQHLLEHNFSELFPIFLSKALKPNGTVYMTTLAQFFRLSNDGETSFSEILLKYQWPNISPIRSSSIHLQVIYENCGTFLFACILYLTMMKSNEKSDIFLLLATMAPILLLFEDGGRPENAKVLVNEIAKISSQFDNTGKIENISGLYQIISDKFSFCTEQFLKSLFVNLPLFKQEIIGEVLASLTPWFSSISFGYEYGFFLKDSELIFTNFSCYSFIECLSSSFSAPDDFNNPIFSVWKSFIIKDDEMNENYLPILHILFDLGEKEGKNIDSLVNLVHYIATFNPPFAMVIVTSKINFSEYFQKHKSMKETKNQTNYKFVLKCLVRLCNNYIQLALPYLNFIFSFAVVFRSLYFNEILELLNCLLTSIEPFIQEDVKPFYEELKSSFNVLNCHRIAHNENMFLSIDNTSNNDRYLSIDSAEFRSSCEFDFDTDCFANFLKAFDPGQLNEYYLKLLRWGLCCGELGLSSSALNGHPIVANDLVIGLTARALSNVSFAILKTTHEKKPIYVNYIKSVISFLSSLFDEMKEDTPDSAIFWIACELLKCPQREIFCGALHLFDKFISEIKFFSFVNGSIVFDEKNKIVEGKRFFFTEKSLFKFHAPWNEDYEGCLNYILLNARSEYETAINVLCHLILIKYPKLISCKKNCLSVLLLALLPYFWNEIALNVLKCKSRKLAQIQLLIETINKMLIDPKFDQFTDSFPKSLETLKKCFLFENRTKLKDLFCEVADSLIKDADFFDSKMIAAFFTSAITYGKKSMMIPLIIVVTRIVRAFPSVLSYLKGFYFIVVKQQIDSQNEMNGESSYRDESIIEFLSLFIKSNGSNENLSNSESTENTSSNENHNENTKINDESISISNSNRNEAHNNNENTIATSQSSVKMASNGNVNKFDSFSNIVFRNDDDDDNFPVLKFFDRIVVVLIPHLYESNIGYQVSIEFEDLNSFPPLLPFDESLLSVERFQNLYNFIQQIDVTPFADWIRVMRKMQFYLHDDNFVPEKLVEKTPEINVKDILINEFSLAVLQSNQNTPSEEEERNEEEEEEKTSLITLKLLGGSLPLKDDDAYSLVAMDSACFVPSIEIANSVGDDIFEEENS